ncbi:hypothetical protein LTR95_004825 [Oleoguttula sp. CCFEE 5521]
MSEYVIEAYGESRSEECVVEYMQTARLQVRRWSNIGDVPSKPDYVRKGVSFTIEPLKRRKYGKENVNTEGRDAFAKRNHLAVPHPKQE